MPRVISIAVVVAVLTVPLMGLIAILRIVIVVVHGRVIICTLPVLLLLCLQGALVARLFLGGLRSTYLLVSLILKVLIWLIPGLGRPLGPGGCHRHLGMHLLHLFQV